jgi:hypothetical protein
MRVAVLAAAIGLGQGGHATAEPAGAPQAPPARSGLAHLASEIAAALGTVSPQTLVVASPLVSDVSAPKADELATRIAAQVAARLPGARPHTQPATLGAARALSGRAASLVHLQIEISKGQLRVTADLYPVVSNGWERLKNAAPGPRAHAFVHMALDAEVRSFLTPVLLEQATLHRAKHQETDVLAVGCGDADGDGGMELVLISRQRVALGRIRGGAFTPSRTSAWSGLASRAPVPMREALGSAVIAATAHGEGIFAGITDRGGVALDERLVTRGVLSGIPVPGGGGRVCAVPDPELGVFSGAPVPCTEAPEAKLAPAISAASPGVQRYDAFAALELVGKDGGPSDVVATREPGGKLRIRWSARGSARTIDAALEGVGAQIAVADLDLDGAPEIVASADGAEEALTVSSLAAKGNVTTRLRFPSKEAIRAVSTCPPEEKGVPAVVAVVGSEVWLVR